jgi:hypothetical protein
MQTHVTPRSSGSRLAVRRQVPLRGRGGRLGAYLVLTVAGASLSACAAVQRPDPVDLRPLPIRPATGLTGTRVIVLPVSSMRHGDTYGWAESVGNPRDYLADLNAQIEHALASRAPRTAWVFPAEIVRLASRNPGYLSDPYGTDASQFAPDRWRPGGKLEDPLAGDLRTYTSFVDARVALVPVELRFFPRPVPTGYKLALPVQAMVHADSAARMGRAVLRVAIVDTRSLAIMWVSDVVSDPAPALTPAVAANLADHLARALAAE